MAPIPSSAYRVRDPHDQVFLDLALAADTPVLGRRCRPVGPEGGIFFPANHHPIRLSGLVGRRPMGFDSFLIHCLSHGADERRGFAPL